MQCWSDPNDASGLSNEEWRSWVDLKEMFLHTYAKMITLVEDWRRPNIFTKGVARQSHPKSWFGRLLPYLQKKNVTTSFNMAMINGLQRNLIVASAASN